MRFHGPSCTHARAVFWLKDLDEYLSARQYGVSCVSTNPHSSNVFRRYYVLRARQFSPYAFGKMCFDQRHASRSPSFFFFFFCKTRGVTGIWTDLILFFSFPLTNYQLGKSVSRSIKGRRRRLDLATLPARYQAPRGVLPIRQSGIQNPHLYFS